MVVNTDMELSLGQSLLTGGGVAGLIWASAFAWHQFRASRREDEAAPREAATSAVTDAGAANSILLATLQDNRVELDRREGENERLRIQNAKLYEEKRQLIHKYEAELDFLRTQLKAVSDRLESVQVQLRAEDETKESDEQRVVSRRDH